MAKKLVVLRNPESSTYAVHLEHGDPPQKLVGGLSLDLARLKVELGQHSCSEEMITKALQDLETVGSTTIDDCT